MCTGSNQIPLPTNSGIQEVFCVRNDFVPLWLAKIQITEKTREERRVIREEFLEGDADYEDEVTFTADSVEDLIQQIENADNLYRRDILSQHERQVGRGFDFVV